MAVPVGFEDFVREHSSALLRAGWLLTGDWPAAEDLVQGALAVAWSHWDEIRDPAAAPAYVRTALLRAFLRGRRRRWLGEVPTAVLPEDGPAGHPTPDADLRLDLQRALATLPARQRAVLVLRFFADLSEADAAAALGCSVGSVKAHASRGLARLRETGLLSGELPREMSG